MRMLGLGKSIHRLTAENDSSTNITINVGDADSVMSDAATAAADIAEIETQDSLGELEAEQVDIAATAAESMFSRIRTMQRVAASCRSTASRSQRPCRASASRPMACPARPARAVTPATGPWRGAWRPKSCQP